MKIRIEINQEEIKLGYQDSEPIIVASVPAKETQIIILEMKENESRTLKN